MRDNIELYVEVMIYDSGKKFRQGEQRRNRSVYFSSRDR